MNVANKYILIIGMRDIYWSEDSCNLCIQGYYYCYDPMLFDSWDEADKYRTDNNMQEYTVHSVVQNTRWSLGGKE